MNQRAGEAVIAAWDGLVTPGHRELRSATGGCLHYLDLGQGTPVVLVHGFADSTFSWHATAPDLLAAGLRLILVDQPGMGRSTIPPRSTGLSIENQAAGVLKVLDHLQLERSHMIGHSMGGGIALYLCLRHPGRLDRVAAIAPVCRRFRRRLALTWPGVAQLACWAPDTLIYSHGLKQTFRDPRKVTRQLVAHYVRGAANRGFWRGMARLSEDFFSPELDRLTASLEQITAPLQLIWGEHDHWISARQGAWIHERIKDCRLDVIGEASHNVHQERPAEVNALLLDHLLGSAVHVAGAGATDNNTGG